MFLRIHSRKFAQGDELDWEHSEHRGGSCAEALLDHADGGALG